MYNERLSHLLICPAESHLHDGDARADVDQEVWEDVGVICLKSELRVGVFLIHEGLVRDVLQHKVTPLYQAGHHVFFVHSGREKAQPLGAVPAPKETNHGATGGDGEKQPGYA
jgi:hypothetical protein